MTIPILSAMKVQCCPVPTAFFTNHTGFDSFAWTDNTSHLDDYIAEWRKLNLRFNAIQTGFLGSREQVDFVLRFLAAFRTPETIVCIDPVMGDYGKLYPTYDKHLAESMRGFLDVADILTPNLTEACFLADEPYRTDFSDTELAALCEKLAARHADRIVISGIPRGDTLVNFIYETGRGTSLCVEPRIGADRSGTGDVFASVILGDAVNGVDFAASVHKASQFTAAAVRRSVDGDAVNGVDFATSVCKASRFTAAAVRRSVELGIPEKDGLAIEEVLREIIF